MRHWRKNQKNVINGETLQGISLEVVNGKVRRVEEKKAVGGKRKGKEVPVKPVRKSTSLSASTAPKTSMKKPLELDDDEENVTAGQVAELMDRAEIAEKQIKEVIE